MANDWIVDVIRDLRRFAELNDLPQLSRQLEIVDETACRELDLARAASDGGKWETHVAGYETAFGVVAIPDA